MSSKATEAVYSCLYWHGSGDVVEGVCQHQQKLPGQRTEWLLVHGHVIAAERHQKAFVGPLCGKLTIHCGIKRQYSLGDACFMQRSSWSVASDW